MPEDKAPNVHPFEDKSGEVRYAVCVWNQGQGQYTAPLDGETRRLTGCSGEFAKTLAGIGGYKSEAKARRRARLLYGYSKIDRS